MALLIIVGLTISFLKYQIGIFTDKKILKKISKKRDFLKVYSVCVCTYSIQGIVSILQQS